MSIELAVRDDSSDEQDADGEDSLSGSDGTEEDYTTTELRVVLINFIKTRWQCNLVIFVLLAIFAGFLVFSLENAQKYHCPIEKNSCSNMYCSDMDSKKQSGIVCNDDSLYSSFTSNIDPWWESERVGYYNASVTPFSMTRIGIESNIEYSLELISANSSSSFDYHESWLHNCSCQTETSKNINFDNSFLQGITLCNKIKCVVSFDNELVEITMNCTENFNTNDSISCTHWENETNSIQLTTIIVNDENKNVETMMCKFSSANSFLYVECSNIVDSNNKDTIYQCFHRELFIYWYDERVINLSIVMISSAIPMTFFLYCYLMYVCRKKINRRLDQIGGLPTCMFQLCTFLLILGMLIVLGAWVAMGIPALSDVYGGGQVAPQIVLSVMFWGCIFSIVAQLIVLVLEWVVYIKKHYEP